MKNWTMGPGRCYSHDALRNNYRFRVRDCPKPVTAADVIEALQQMCAQKRAADKKRRATVDNNSAALVAFHQEERSRMEQQAARVKAFWAKRK
jgi:hypothetical protein